MEGPTPCQAAEERGHCHKVANSLLAAGHAVWQKGRRHQRPFPGVPYVLLHTLTHLLLESFSTRCGYPASSIRERIYAGAHPDRYGLLLYTGSPDADGTLGGLVREERHIENHHDLALRAGELCSSDPICSRHEPGKGLEERWLHGGGKPRLHGGGRDLL